MTAAQHSLYTRLGGYDVIAAVIDDMFTAMRTRARQLLVDQMCQLSGGPCVYIGSHAGLGITAAEWTGNMVHAETALVGNDVAGPERAEFLGLFERYRDEIVERG